MKLFYSILLMLSISFCAAQTNPAVQTLPYSENFTTLAHTSTTYPNGWIGWIGAAPATTFSTAAPTGDRVLIASSTAAVNSGNVHNYNGKIGFLNNGSSDFALALAVNTTGTIGVAVAYDVMTIRNPFGTTGNSRINELTLQYRVGITGTFTTLTGIEYQNNTVSEIGAVTTPQNVLNKTITLPAACNNQPVVQLRWISREVSGAGARPSFAVDNVTVGLGTADILPPLVTTLTPADDATNVAITTPLTILFNEPIQKGTGNILVKRLSDNTTVQTIDVATAAVTVTGSTATINITPLVNNTAYFIEVAAGAFKDIANNNFAGIVGNSLWNFTTANAGGATSLNVDFNTCAPPSALTNGFTQFSITGAQIWACTTFGRDPANPAGTAAFPNAVQINGFASGSNVINEDWLISPSLNLTGFNFPLLSFWSRTAFNGAPLKLRVSTNYIGTGNPTAATWVDLTGQFPAQVSNFWKLSQNINLTAYKTANTYFAFVYNSTDDDGARWTIDDIKIDNSTTPPPASLTPNTSEVNFGFVASATTAVKQLNFVGNDIVGAATLTATGNFLISKTNSNFTSSISFTQAEANNITNTIFIQFAPTAANTNYTGTLTIATPTVADTIIALKGNSTDAATTLDVVNWNIEWFGSTTLGPTNNDLQEQNVKTILQNLNADVYALQEIVSEPRLANVVSQMPGYAYVVSNYASNTNPTQASPSPFAEAQKLGYIYKTALFPQGVATQALLSAGVNTAADLTNPAYNWFASGRFPFMMTGTTTLNGVTKTIRFINVHAKANTSPTITSYNRRKAGNDSLRTHLNNFYPNDNIIFLGDFNDDLDSTITAGIAPRLSSYKQFVDDATNFFPATLPLSLAGKKSTVSFNDVIDHVVLSNEMKCSYITSSAAILTDVASLVANYGNTTTDHYPAYSRYLFTPNYTATISYASTPYCVGATTATPTLTGNTTGTYSSTTGLIIDAATGAINLATSAPGSYTVSYSLPATSCANAFTTTTTVAINAASIAPTSAISNTTLICAVSGSINLSAAGGTLGAGAVYRWYTGSCGGNLIGTGVTLNNVFVNSTTTYFVRAEGTCNTTTCASVTVVVSPRIVVEVTVAPNTGATPAMPTTIVATVSPAGNYNYVWTKNNQTILPINADRIVVPASEVGLYNVKVANATGCVTTTNNVLVTSGTSPNLFITANPNNGIFNVSFSNSRNTLNARVLNVYDSKGAIVFTKTYSNIVPFSFMKVDISNKAKGVYYIELLDGTRKRLAQGSVIKL